MSMRNSLLALSLGALGIALAAAGILIGEADDAPGAALAGIIAMVGALAFAANIVRRKPKHS